MQHYSEIIFVRLLVPLMIGICCFYNLKEEVYYYSIFSATNLIFLSLVGLNIYYKSIRAYRFKYFTGIVFSLLFFSLGGWICLLNSNNLNSTYFGNLKYDQLKVWIAEEPQQGNKTTRFIANVTAGYHQQKYYPASGKLLISVKNDSVKATSFNYGDELIIATECTALTPPFNLGEFDFKSWLASKNVYMQTFLTQHQLIKTSLNQGNPILKYALQLRKVQVVVYEKLIRDKEAFAVASTLILGYRADLSDETLSSYSKTGTIHALSVSGMHVGIIYVVLNWLLRFMNRKRWTRIAKVLIICTLIWFYSLLTGFSPSVLRSAIMLTAYILAKSLNKHTNGYNILAFTAFCLLIYNPFLIYDVGFQLSFLAVLGLVYLHPKIYKWFYFKAYWADWIWSSVAMSLAAQIATFPLSIYYFHQFPLYFILSNLFILIPITLLMYLGISILLFKVYFLAPIFEWLIIFMNDGLKWIANLPFSGIDQIWINPIQLTLLTIALLLGSIALSLYKKRMLFAATFLLALFQLSLTIKNISIKKQKSILFFSLQKGYGAAFIHGQEAVFVSNLSKKDKNFQFYILPALQQLQIKKTSFTTWETDRNLGYFIKKDQQIYFNGFRMLLYDQSFNRKAIKHMPMFNTVWLHHNPKIKLSELKKTVKFKSLIIDASNSAYSLRNYTDEAKKLQVLAHVLKKNKAYLIDLNNRP